LSAPAHPACAPSGIYDFPGVATAFHHVAVQVATDGFENMLTSLGVRHIGSPQALLLLEPHTIFGSAGHSGLEQYATRIGLAPIAAPSPREAAAPRAPNTHHLSVGADTVPIIHPEGVETAEADPTVLQLWVSAADAHDDEVLVILGRGLQPSAARPAPKPANSSLNSRRRSGPSRSGAPSCPSASAAATFTPLPHSNRSTPAGGFWPWGSR
jgi:hypothetical protein